MKDQLQTIRAGLETATCYSMLGVDAHSVQIALTALTQLEAMVGEPYGTVTVVRKPGCADMHWFYRWPDPPYLDNAAECHTVYTAAPVAQQPLITVEDSLRFRLDCTKEQLEAAEQECAELRAKLKAQQPQAEAVRDPEAVAEGLAQIIFEAINPGKVWTYQSTDTRNAYWSAAQVAKEFLK